MHRIALGIIVSACLYRTLRIIAASRAERRPRETESKSRPHRYGVEERSATILSETEPGKQSSE